MTDDTFYDSVSLQRLTTPRLSTVYRHNGRDWQDAESVLFIHGSLASGRWWEPTIASFEELMPSKYACYAPDLRSHGDADPLPVHGMQSFADDLLSMLDTIGIKRTHIVGWSMGGGAAMQLALDHPERCLSLVLVSSLSPYGTGEAYIPANRQQIGELIERGQYEALAKVVRAGNFREGRFPLNNTPPGNALFYYLLQSAMQTTNYPGDEANGEGNSPAMKEFNLAARTIHFGLPVLSLHGTVDHFVSSEYNAQARRAWPPALFREVIFEGAGHTPQVEQPRRFAAALDDFFSGLGL